MKTYLECIPCFFRQAIEASKLANASEDEQSKIIKDLCKAISLFSLRSSPPEMAETIHSIIKQITKQDDPYAHIKDQSNLMALEMYPVLKKQIDNADDRLQKSLELAIAGNIIDFGAKNSLNINEEINKILKNENICVDKIQRSFFDYKKFKDELKKTKNILFLGDNAGEIVFDKLFIEEIIKLYPDIQITYAVKEKPIINDALKKDASQCGMNQVANIISNGTSIPGTILSRCSKKFQDVFQKAEMIISKGQGNFESLSDCNKSIFFLFKVKCDIVANDANAKLGDLILFYSKGKNK